MDTIALDPPLRRARPSDARVRAELIAQASATTGLSLIVADSNAGARRLYERLGYREVTTRPLVKNGWECEAERWVLLATT